MAESVATGVIQLFLHPPLGLLRLERIPGGPWSGLSSHQRPRLNTPTDAYGIRYSVSSFPPGYGLTPGPGNNIFDRTIVRLAIVHQLFDGSLVTSQEASLRASSLYVLFNESFPRNVAVETAPGIEVELDWMIRLIGP